LKSIFTFETIEDIREKEEKMEKKIKKNENYQSEITNQNGSSIFEDKKKNTNTISNNHKNKLKNAEGNMKIDSMFYNTNN